MRKREITVPDGDTYTIAAPTFAQMEAWALTRQEHFGVDPVAKAAEVDDPAYPMDARKAFMKRTQEIAFEFVCTCLNRAGDGSWNPERIRQELDPYEWEYIYGQILEFVKLKGGPTDSVAEVKKSGESLAASSASRPKSKAAHSPSVTQ